MAPRKNNNTSEKEKKAQVKPPGRRRKIEKPKLKTPDVIKYKLPPISIYAKVKTTSNTNTDSQEINSVATKKEKSQDDHLNQEISQPSKTQEIKKERKPRKKSNKLNSTCNVVNQDKEISLSCKSQEIIEEKKPRKKNNKLSSICNVVNQDKGNTYVRRKITLKSNGNEAIPKPIKKAKRKLDELNLANEVVMAQFPKNKKCKISEETPLVISITNTSFVNNKLSPENSRIVENDATRTVNNISFKKRGRQKKFTNALPQTPKVNRKRKADSTITPRQTSKVELITRTICNTMCNDEVKDCVNVKDKDSTRASDFAAEDNLTSPSILNQVSLDVEHPRLENATIVKLSSPLKRTKDMSTITTPSAGKMTKDLSINKLTSQSQVKKVESGGLLQNGSRRSSNSYISDYLSWTKDISSSSTTTCITVSSDDVVRIDGKIPVVRIHNKVTKGIKTHKRFFLSGSESTNSGDVVRIDGKIPVVRLHSKVIKGMNTQKRRSFSGSESSSNNSIKDLEKEINSLPEVLVSNLLNLSTASTADSESDKSNQECAATNDNNKLKSALNKMSLNMKLFDLEFINWALYDNAVSDIFVSSNESELFEIIKEEQNLIACCRNIKYELSGEVKNKLTSLEFDTSVSNDIGKRPIDQRPKETKGDFGPSNAVDKPSTIFSKQKTEESSKHKYFYPTDQNDDDDALSLFAESISGIESSKERGNDSIVNNDISVPDFEEYVPQPISNMHRPPEINYYPTKILEKDDEVNENSATKHTVCEKQNADSTSIYRVPEQEEKDTVDKTKFIEYEPVEICSNYNFNNIGSTPFLNYNKPNLIKDFPLKPIIGVKSYVLRGVCFYNLISTCKRANCVFPHRELDVTEIQNKIVTLSEMAFVQEYILIRKWPELRRKYSICFINDAVRRNLLKIVLEMGIDSIIKAKSYSKEDKILEVSSIEIILSYLNNIILETCGDLLLYNVGQGVLLCDVFMEVLAETQNFSRFKIVFVNLTNFIVKNRRTFKLTVASNILERVCIFPFDELLYRALIKIIHNTNEKIFENSMMQPLQKRLASLDNNLLQELISHKNRDIPCEIRHSGNNFDTSPQTNQEINRTHNDFIPTEREKRYTSPDTTNMDNMKGVPEPVFTRTINLPHVIRNYQDNSTRTSTSVDSADHSSQVKSNTSRKSCEMKNWNMQSIMWNTHNKFRNVIPQMRFGMRPPHSGYVEQRRVAFGGHPTIPHRRLGPRFS